MVIFEICPDIKILCSICNSLRYADALNQIISSCSSKTLLQIEDKYFQIVHNHNVTSCKNLHILITIEMNECISYMNLTIYFILLTVDADTSSSNISGLHNWTTLRNRQLMSHPSHIE